jgi:hypothetical protein
MEDALLDKNPFELQCTVLGLILEYSPKETLEGFQVLQSFFVVVQMTSVNLEFWHYPAYFEI